MICSQFFAVCSQFFEVSCGSGSRMRFKLCQKPGAAIDLGACVRAAANRCVRDLNVEIGSSSSKTPSILPRSLYTECGMLSTLKLNNVVILRNVLSSVSFSSLKTLSLLSVKYPSDEFVKEFFIILSCS